MHATDLFPHIDSVTLIVGLIAAWLIAALSFLAGAAFRGIGRTDQEDLGHSRSWDA